MKLLGFSVRRVGKPIIYVPSSSVLKTATADEDVRLQRLLETAEQLKPPPHDHAEHLDKSRSKIANRFVRWYLFFVCLIIVGVPLYNRFAISAAEPIDIYKLLAQVGTLLGTPLGFVVGYYFKEDHKNS
ncbi:MAG TPA: hypothetical protein VNX65_01435 [Patescibacteria group bacterium]|jgi:hypothetical protein|nr:hypothetical protein [Patescibacteria group bacterium]